MKAVVVVENVSKKFTRRANTHKSYGIRSLVNELLGRSRDIVLRQDEFLAVNNVSFELYPGETLALVGRNGCGKTTTLKMLNGTLKPDAGKIIINGRVQALIALGAGFNLRLSGRENIYNAAAVLGLSSKETTNIIDEVIDFSELEDFIDSPVETYSSGMYARLGFSVAVHLKPEILLVDEILSVGDYAFQHKSFAKMQQLKSEGTGIILVSHAHSRVLQLCERAIWLHHGEMLKSGNSREVIKAYLRFMDEQTAKKVQQKSNNAPSKNQVSPTNQTKKEYRDKFKNTIYGEFLDDTEEHISDLDVALLVQNQKVASFNIHDELVIEYGFSLKHHVENLNINLVFYRKEDGFHLGKISTLNEDVVKHIHHGCLKCRVTIPDFNLNPGNYVLLMAIFEGHSFLYRNVVREFVVKGDGKMTYGLVAFNCRYEVL